MASNSLRLSTKELNTIFVNNLGDSAIVNGQISDKPLLVDFYAPVLFKLRVYLYNCTNPPGGRSSNEYKSQIIVPGQARGSRGNFEFSADRIVLLCAYTRLADDPESGVFVFWDPMYHIDFAYSANIQVKDELLIRALVEKTPVGRKNNGESIVACRPINLIEGIKTRIATV